MIKVVSTSVMRESDAYTIKNLIPSKELMRRAGVGIFNSGKWVAPVGIVCGSGNNAGDGYVVAALLCDAGVDCEIILLKDKFSEDGKYYFDIAVSKGVPVRKFNAGVNLKKYGSILDCLLGTGFTGDITGPMAEVINAINDSGAYVVSADINSGLNGDTGNGGLFVRSELTVSIGDFKYGHFIGRAGEAMKDKVNIDIGIKIIGPCEYIDDHINDNINAHINGHTNEYTDGPIDG